MVVNLGPFFLLRLLNPNDAQALLRQYLALFDLSPLKFLRRVETDTDAAHFGSVPFAYTVNGSQKGAFVQVKACSEVLKVVFPLCPHNREADLPEPFEALQVLRKHIGLRCNQSLPFQLFVENSAAFRAYLPLSVHLRNQRGDSGLSLMAVRIMGNPFKPVLNLRVDLLGSEMVLFDCGQTVSEEEDLRHGLPQRQIVRALEHESVVKAIEEGSIGDPVSLPSPREQQRTPSKPFPFLLFPNRSHSLFHDFVESQRKILVNKVTQILVDPRLKGFVVVIGCEDVSPPQFGLGDRQIGLPFKAVEKVLGFALEESFDETEVATVRINRPLSLGFVGLRKAVGIIAH